jgi:streptogramin lyase
VAVEDDVVHQLWFIARRGPGAVMAVLAPLRNVIETVRVEMVGNEVLRIDARDLEARHLRLKTDGTGAIRDVWIDSAGHLLKVAIPATKIVAVRDEPPR